MTAKENMFLVFVTLIGMSIGKPVDISTTTLAYNFLYIGNVEGKIYLKAILPTAEQYGVPWLRAVEICADSGYRMASITSKAQDDVVAKFVTSNGPDSRNWMWIDGSNYASSDQSIWYSLNTGKPLTFFNWVRSRPVTPFVRGTRDCLRWSSNSLDAGWWDIECTDTHNVLCETSVV